MTSSLDLKEVVDLLQQRLQIRDEEFIAYYLCRNGFNPFEVLISIILSQNTRDDLALKAFNNLREVLGVITPETVLKHPVKVIEDALKVSGLHRRKSSTIVELAKAVKSAEALGRMPHEDVRKLLLSVKGVGYKTVDVFMLMCRGVKVFPIDTHIKRVLARLAVTDRGDDYLEIQRKVHELLPPDHYLRAHLLLIELGRRYCRARKPLCGECPLSSKCPKKY